MNDSFVPPRGFGYKHDRPDPRDHKLYGSVRVTMATPDTADLSRLYGPAYDQEMLSSCLGWSIAKMTAMIMKKDGRRRPFMPSPAFIYREARVLGGYGEEYDGGAEMRHGWHAAHKFGLPPASIIPPTHTERHLPNMDGIFPENSIWRRKAAPSRWVDAERRQVSNYFRLPGVDAIIQSIADGYPVNIGIPIYRSFYDAYGNPRRHVPNPMTLTTDRLFGWHAVIAHGYDIPNRLIWCQNQWGEGAHEGTPNFSIPIEMVEQYVSDAYTCHSIEGAKLLPK